ncbi:MAG: ATP phosphoribosyltransferase [Xylanivirga thermophila]|uniref:ATP phosphoribosyltransferase n=1 Tax=Xylanivirga thermophila TaxID=2496273 RepID=UPI0039F56E9A
MITIALAKGRLADNAVKLFNKSGIQCSEYDDVSRKLIFHSVNKDIRFALVKPSDVPTYVEYGAADAGIVGKDTLMEDKRFLYEILDLGYGQCKMVVAGFPEKKDTWITSSNMRVATKYPNIAKEYFAQRGECIEIIKLNGSVELGPIMGLSDVIVDIVESGRTLEENGLVVLEEICNISARLIVNRVSLKTKNIVIKHLIDSLDKALKEDIND